MPHNNSVTYALTRGDDVAANTLQQRKLDGGVEYFMVCARCDGQFTRPHFDDVFRAARLFGRAQPADTSTIPVICDCGYEHPGHPEGETGCGNAWEILR